MKPLRQLNITAIVSSDGIRDDAGARDLFAEQSRSFHFGLLQRECLSLNVLASGSDLTQKLAQLRTDAVLVDAGREEAAVLLTLGSHTGDMPYPVMCFNRRADRDAMLLALESGVSSYVAAAFSVERVGMELDVAIARFTIQRKLRRELLETRRRLAASSAQGLELVS